MIIQTVDTYDFRRAFETCRPDNFSYEGLGLLFDYLDELSDDVGEPVELDVIAICCDYSEDTVQAIADNYSIELPEREEDQDDDEYGEVCTDAVRDYLQGNTSIVGETSDGFVFANF
jgi:hypothetical protein